MSADFVSPSATWPSIDGAFRAMADNAPVLLWLVDEHGDAFFFNSTLLAFCGRTMEQESGRGWIDGVHPDDREEFVAKYEEGFAARVPFEAEVRLSHHNGEYCWMLCRLQPMFDDTSRFSGYTGSAIDISARRHTEDERDDALGLLNAIDLASPVGLAFYGTDFRLQHANPAYFTMFGFDPQKSLGMDVVALMGESRRQHTQGYFEEILRGKDIPDFEVTTERPGRPGEVGTFLVSYYPVSADGSTIAGIGVSVQDVTELRTSQAALRVSEARYRALADTVPQMIWATDASGQATWTNKRSIGYSGTDEQDAPGLGWASMIHPDDSEAALRRWDHSMATGEPYETEVRLRRHDGIYRWHVARAIPVHDADGATLSWIGSSTDVDTLRSGEARYRMLGDAIPQMIWTAAPGGDFTYNNRRFLEYTGLTEEESLHAGWETVMHPDDLQQTRECWQKALATGEAYETEYRLRGTDGGYRWHIARAEPIYEHGVLIAWFGASTDIEGQKQAEAAVSELNRQLNLRLEDLETLLRVLPIGVAISHDPEARDIRMNEALAGMLGMSKSDNGSLSAAIHRSSPPFRIFRDEVEIPPEELVMQAAALRGTEMNDTYRVRRGDGTEIEMLGFATPLKDGERTRGSIGAFVDISEVKRTEQALLTAEGLYQAAGEAIPFGIWASDVDGQTTYLSQSLLDFVGLTLREVQQGRMEEHIVGHTKGQPTAWMRSIDQQSEWVTELEVRGLSGEVCTVLSRGGPLRDHRGKLTGFAGINLDITRRKQMEVDLALTIEELQRANAVKDELLGLVSHELRTPLTTISGNAQALRRHGDHIDPETKAVALQDIENDAARLQRLIENMLVLARLEGAADFEAEPVLLQRLLPRFGNELGRRTRRTVTTDVPVDLAPALAQPVYVEQIIGNLVTNAVKYSAAGTAIELRALEADGTITVFVEDRGQGISADEAAQVFTPFFRSQRTAKYASGIGLGLAVCKRLVEVQGGTVWATPREGGGTTIAFTLPISPEF